MTPVLTRRRVLGTGALALGGLAAGSLGARAPDDFAGVDPEMIDDLRFVRPMVVAADNLAAFRKRPGAPHARPVPPVPHADAPREKRTIPGLPGQPPVTIVVTDVRGGRAKRPAVVWMHGGGYVAGAASVPGALLAPAVEQGWLIVSVDYRLAPEARQPQSLADNYAALRWVHDNADSLGVDRARIAVGGASAGGGHAAMLALAARDRREVPLAYQVLIYPMLDDRTGSSRPALAGTGRYIWTAEANRFGWTSLLGVPAGSARVPAGVVPGRRTDLRGLAPAFIGVGTLDLFVEEDVRYAERLLAAGNPVSLSLVPRAFHAFDGVAPLSRAARDFTARWVGDLAAALA